MKKYSYFFLIFSYVTWGLSSLKETNSLAFYIVFLLVTAIALIHSKKYPCEIFSSDSLKATSLDIR